MSELYRRCEWVIRPHVNYVQLGGIARELGCDLALRDASAVTEDRLVVMRFVLRAPSQTAFDNFLARVGQSIGLDDWQPAAADDFAAAQILDFRTLDTQFLTQWMEAMNTYGLYNAAHQGGHR